MKVAIAGIGGAAIRGHLPALRHLADRGSIEIAAVCDRNPERLGSVAMRWPEVPQFSTAATMLDVVRPELFVIATDPDPHIELIKLGLRFGCHVLCEKPIALHRAARDHLEQWRAMWPQRALVPVHQYRHAAGWKHLATFIDPLGGQPFELTVHVERPGTDPHASAPWRNHPRSGGGLADHGVHYLALARTLSTATAAEAATRHHDECGHEHVHARIRVGSGTLTLTVTYGAPHRRTTITARAGTRWMEWIDRHLRTSENPHSPDYQTVPALSDRDHVDGLYLPHYEELLAQIDNPTWRASKWCEAIDITAILARLYELADETADDSSGQSLGRDQIAPSACHHSRPSHRTSNMTMTSDPMNPWRLNDPVFQAGGRWIVRREQAPLAPTLRYRRAAGERPSEPTTAAAAVRRYGWSVDLGDRGLGNTLLGLGLVQGLADATAPTELSYTGPHPDLMRRCTIPLTVRHADGPHLVHTGHPNPVRYQAIPEHSPAWLDLLDHERVEVHAALPMRYYLAAELALGIGLPATHAPAPTFISSQRVQPFHVVFVATTGSPDRTNYGLDLFVRIAQTLAYRAPAPWTFSMITDPERPAHPALATSLDIQVLDPPDPADCVDVFAAAELVIGNDTGLTHLAALTQRPDGTGPHVVAIHGRHSHTKRTTGAERHHAVATPFSQMLSVADRCPVRDQLTEPVWASAASLAALPAEHIADFAARQAGWW